MSSLFVWNDLGLPDCTPVPLSSLSTGAVTVTHLNGRSLISSRHDVILGVQVADI